MAKKHQYKISSKKNRARAGRKWRHVYNSQLRELQGRLQRGQQAPMVMPALQVKKSSKKNPRHAKLSLEEATALIRERFPEFATDYLPAILIDGDDQVL